MSKETKTLGGIPARGAGEGGDPVVYPYEQHRQYNAIERQCTYVRMRDGVRIAVSVYLPKDLPQGTQLPSLIHQTRYWRVPKLIFPLDRFTLGLLGPDGDRIREIVRQGYAFVSVDARGSGASFGSRAHPWTEDEVQDGVEILDWICKQQWSNGNVGGIGISYSATASEFLATRGHPAFKALALLFSVFDVYEDIALPGGVPFSWFTENWGYSNRQLDKNKIPLKNPLLRLLVRGVLPVNGDRKALKAAMIERRANVDIHIKAQEVQYRDDVFDEASGKSIDVFSPSSYFQKINEANIPVYCYSGWWDGTYQHAAIRRYLNLSHPESKLLLGPWEHRGRMHISPGHGGKVAFDHLGELLKFFDRHLKGRDTGIEQEPAVHYFSMNAEQWKQAEQWPPQSVETERWFFQDKHILSREQPTHISESSYLYEVNLGTGTKTRWRSMVGKLRTPHGYPRLKQHNQKALCFDSAPLSDSKTITGHPMLTLWIQANSLDLACFAYLEEVTASGKVKYITEGMLRAVHRAFSQTPAYQDVVPYRSYKQEEAQALIPGKSTELTFDLLPTSYQIQAGSKIRIAITLGDRDHFAAITPKDTEIAVLHSTQYMSRIDLPVEG
ncbi:MAG: CocE/NonD family hydrolase [Bacteroidota bacterium]